MPIINFSFRYCLLLASVSVLILASSTTPGQQQTPTQQSDEVLRVETQLIQTDVMVFDKQGRFVPDLKQEQFDLLIDGKPQPISFFELVRAGSFNEEAQLAAARGQQRKATPQNQPARPLDRGRTIIFYIDDLHLAFDSLARVRQTLTSFVDGEMGQNDLALIASTSGRLGFLQQFTSNKSVLHTAIEKLSFQPYSVRDSEQPIMTEYMALQVERENRDVLDYLIDETIRLNGGRFPREMAENMARSRARQVAQQANYITNNTLLTLGSLVRNAAQIPGRKNIFFISDGFFVDHQNSDAGDKLRRLTDIAARSGSVIYTMDARGLFSGLADASSREGPDITGRLSRARAGEIVASQEALNQLAADTGGRAILNNNSLITGLRKSLEETSSYYLLAWTPTGVEQKAGKYHKLEVKVKDRPNLTVRVQRGFFDADNIETSAATKEKTNNAAGATAADPAKQTADQLRAAIGAIIPPRALPTALTLNFVDTPEGAIMLTASMHIASGAMLFDEVGKNANGAVDVMGMVFDIKGQPGASFQNRLNVSFEKDKAELFHRRGVFYNYQLRLPPGLYQVRVAARDSISGRLGSASQWIEIPDLRAGKLALSSLVLGEVLEAPAANNATNTLSPVEASVERRFSRNTKLRFLLFIYNAARGLQNNPAPATETAAQSSPDLATQIQILRDNQPVLTTPVSKVVIDAQTDLARVPYAAEMATSKFPPGRYLLQVTVIDRVAKSSAKQSVDFEVR